MSIPLPMPVISRNCPAYTNDDFSGAFPASNANNLLYGNYWRCATAPTGNTDSGALTQSVYLAYDLSASAPLGQAVVAWYNDPSTGAYNPTLISNAYHNTPASYTIDANAAAGGSLPSSGWVTLATVTNSLYHSRQHAVDLTGYNWVRINVTAINGSISNNNIQINLDVHDARNGNQDNIIFYGDSITQRGLDHTDTILPSLINSVQSNRWPLTENGGIGGYLSTDGANNISTWLPLFSGKYVALLYGTNDANNAAVGDPNFANNFTTQMTTMLNAVVSAGKIPIMPASIPWGKTTNIQGNGPIINTCLTSLFASFPTAIKGPDLWAYFNANQSLINANDVHPTDPAGYTAYRQQWANALIANLYTSSESIIPSSPALSLPRPLSLTSPVAVLGEIPLISLSAVYQLAGVTLDTPMIASAPLGGSGLWLPAESSFTLLFHQPSVNTQTVLQNNVSRPVAMTFVLPSSEMATGQVRYTLTKNTDQSLWQAHFTTLQFITVQH